MDPTVSVARMSPRSFEEHAKLDFSGQLRPIYRERSGAQRLRARAVASGGLRVFQRLSPCDP
jgi:hypothetical protein